MSRPAVTAGPVEAYDKEALVKRNPHADFAAVEASRPPFDSSKQYTFSKTPNPSWQPGDGASNDEWKKHQLLAIDPNDENRPWQSNYKLIISSLAPRPIALVSTVSETGIRNLAPFSYFNAVSTDPPLYSVSFVGEDANDSLTNCLDTGELCISIISDWYLEAANFSSVNTAPHVSEWPFTGLHPLESTKVKPPHPAEAAFSIECKVHSSVPIYSKQKRNEDGSKVRTATMVLCEAVLFHVRKDAVNERRDTVNLKVLRPVWRGGGITYGCLFDGWETPRPMAFRDLLKEKRVKDIMDNIDSGDV